MISNRWILSGVAQCHVVHPQVTIQSIQNSVVSSTSPVMVYGSQEKRGEAAKQPIEPTESEGYRLSCGGAPDPM
jgi:hypothetical protein